MVMESRSGSFIRVAVFIALSYGFAFTIDLLIALYIPRSPRVSPIWGFVRMWTVALSTVICLSIFREDVLISIKRYLGFSRRSLLYFLVAPLIVYGSLGIYILLATPLDLFNFNVVVDTIADELRKALPQLSEEQIRGIATISAYSQIPIAYLASITINALYALGEELGWRGYLYNILGSKPNLYNTIIIGTLWGLWHSTAILLLGYNYTVERALGVFLFTLLSMALTYPYLLIVSKSGSVLPASSLHGAVNALWTLTVVANNLAPSQKEIIAGLGILGIATWLLTSTILYLLNTYLSR